MKKILLKLISAVSALCVVFQPFTALSQNAGINTDEGAEFDITAELVFGEPAYAVCLDIIYDPNILEFVSADKTNNCLF